MLRSAEDQPDPVSPGAVVLPLVPTGPGADPGAGETQSLCRSPHLHEELGERAGCNGVWGSALKWGLSSAFMGLQGGDRDNPT